MLTCIGRFSMPFEVSCTGPTRHRSTLFDELRADWTNSPQTPTPELSTIDLPRPAHLSEEAYKYFVGK